jgi:glycosyltransferase involved in cell wall biosynthesis
MDAFIEAHREVPDAHLVVVGDGTARPKLEAQIEKAGLSENAHFLGRVVGDNLPQLYRTGTVFAITSKTETQSIVLMEAMASGLPCVAVDAGAIHELVKTNKNGYLCEPDDVAAVSSSLVKILSNPERREKMSAESIKRAAKHDISYTLTRMEEIYNKVLDDRARELD